MESRQGLPEAEFRRLDRALRLTFKEESSGTGPLTWGQQDMWDARENVNGNDAVYNFALPLRLPLGTTADDIAQVVSWVMRRHEVLRTLFRRTGGQPQQVVRQDGTTEVHFYQTASFSRGVATNFVEQCVQPLFDIEREFPVRFDVLELDNGPEFMSLSFSHVAMDGYAARLIGAEIEAVLAGSPPAAGPAWTPLEQASYENSPEGARRNARSLSFWRTMLDGIPPRLFDACGAGYDVESSAILEMRSSAASRAAAVVARRAGVSTAAAVLAAIVSQLASFTGKDVIPLQLLVGNRFDKRTASLVTNTVLNGICAIKAAGVPFDTLVKRCYWAATKCYSRACYDPRHLADTIASVGEQRGCTFDLGVFFNDGRPEDKWLAAFTDGVGWPADNEIEALRSDTTIEFLSSCEVNDLRLDVEITYLSELDCHLRMRADPTCMSADEVRAMLLTVEETLVRASQELP